MSRDEIMVLLMVMQTEMVNDLNDQARLLHGDCGSAMGTLAGIVDSISIEYHMSQIDERMREHEDQTL